MPTRARDGRHVLIAAIVLEVLAVWFVHWIDTRGYMDTEIYRLGARAWLNGYQVYGDDLTPETPDSATLPFIYPPFAAILFAPLALVPKAASTAVIMVVSHLALLTTLYVVLRSAPFLQAHRDRVLLVVAAVLPLATISEPVLETITYAQINIVLMALVAVDCLWRVDGPKQLPYPRG